MDINKYRELFLSGVKEKLDEMTDLAVTLEKEPKNKDLIDSIFRNAHSIKGMAATMGYNTMSKLSHKLENLFDKIRNKELEVSESVGDVILKTHFALTEILGGVQKKNSDEYPIDKIVRDINDVIEGKVSIKKKEKTKINMAIPHSVSRDSFVRVRAGHLDKLIDVISEFISLKHRLKSIGKGNGSGLDDEIEQMEKLILEMNDKVLSMRMLPLSLLTAKLPRMVRSISKDLGKVCELEVSGEAVELDKNIIESLESPIIHIIRNCIDHGIEKPKVREKLGKGKSGNVFFKAFRYQNQVAIEIGDDGKGIDLKKIEGKAVEKNIINQMDLDLMDEEKKYLLVCAPGISTHENITELSGRGVGMDIVKSSIESLGGALSIFSGLSMGTTFKITLPLTTAILKVFVVEVYGVQYGIPSSSLYRVEELSSSLLKEDKVGHYVSLEEEDMRFYHLGKILDPEFKMSSNPFMNTIIIKNEESKTVLEVDKFHGMEEVIVRPLSTVLKFFKGISGVTILPEGRPMLILNPEELIKS